MLINSSTSSSIDVEHNEISISKEQSFEEDAPKRKVGLLFKLFPPIPSLISFWGSKPKIPKDTGYERLLNKPCQSKSLHPFPCLFSFFNAHPLIEQRTRTHTKAKLLTGSFSYNRQILPMRLSPARRLPQQC
jgi:hypothetical protein